MKQPFALAGGTRHIHIVGICGTAMASLAGMLKTRHFHVTGSDSGVYPPMSTFLEHLGIPVAEGYAAANLHPRPDLVVIGNSIARGNPELEAVLDEGLPYASMPEVLRMVFLQDKLSVVVAGTHGKTTTTSMLAWSLHALGAQPSFLVGGIPANFGSSFAVTQGDHFVVEGDEYDTAYFDKAPKFFHYRPHHLVVTSVEYDHADIYPDLPSYLLQFRRLVGLVPARGFLAFHQGCPRTREIAATARCRTESFGLSADAIWQARGIRSEASFTRFEAWYRGHALGEVRLDVPGEYNVLNALATCAILNDLGFPWAGIASALEGFRGVERRMTLRGEPCGVKVYDDFAHHPTAIRETLRGARMRFPHHRILAVFEPRSWTCRKSIHQDAMTQCFSDADTIILADVFRKEQLAESDRFHPEEAVAAMRAKGQDAHFLPSADDIVEFLSTRTHPGDVVVIMSNGGFDGIYDRLVGRLSRNEGTMTSGCRVE